MFNGNFNQAKVIPAILCLLGLVACGGGGSVNSVTITPSVATISFGQTQQFKANTSVTWQVNGVTGGNSTVGTIDGNGLYTAPAVAGTYSITAVSTASSSVTGAASVTVGAGIQVSPANVTLGAGATQQFNATITGSTSTTATWLVNGVVGGNSTAGTISTSGLYTAPSTVSTPTTVTVSAQVPTNSAQQANATVNLTQPPLQISPAAPTVAAGGTVNFTATATGTSVTPTWSISCDPASSAGCGSIDANGVYTAPLSPPLGGTVTVTASTASGNALSSSTSATIQFSARTLTGSYAFFFSPPGNQQIAAAAGTITLDGNGNITGGTIDRSDSPGVPITITGGSYQVGADGRGTAIVVTSSGNASWQLVATDHGHGFASVFEVANGKAFAASGNLELQDSAQFGAINGNFAASLSGVNTTAAPAAMAGSLTGDGGGNITAGTLDINDNFTVSNTGVSGTYTTPGADGRGTITLGALQFNYTQIDSSHFCVVETDGKRAAAGMLVMQPAGPFSTATLTGPFAVVMNGHTGAGALAMGGFFTTNGSGTVTSRALDGVNQTVFDTGGQYAVTDPNTGRTTLSWTVNGGHQTDQYVIYPSVDGFVLLEADANVVGAGIVLPQTITNPTVFSQRGSYSVSLDGAELANQPSPEHVAGTLLLPGGSAFSGSLDVDNNGAATVGQPLSAGVYSVDSSGHGIVSVLANSSALPSGTLNIYIVDTNRSLVLESDSKRILAGKMVRQF